MDSPTGSFCVICVTCFLEIPRPRALHLFMFMFITLKSYARPFMPTFLLYVWLDTL